MMSDDHAINRPSSMPGYPSPGRALEMPIPPGPPPFESPQQSEAPLTHAQIMLRRTGWAFLIIFSLTFFTLVKLPQEKVKAFIQGTLASQLASRGITMTAGESKMDFWFGVSYVMQNVVLNFPPPSPTARIEEIKISPSIFPLLLGKLGGTIEIVSGSGSLSVEASVKGTRLAGSINARQFDIGKTGLLKAMADINASAVINGKAEFFTDTASMTDTDASVDLDLRKVTVDAQSISGFSIPKLSVAQGKLELQIDHGKGDLRILRLGKADSATDDLWANITGEILLGKRIENSTCNLKATFSLSQSARTSFKAFSLLEQFMTQAKLPDGSYSYRLSGPLLSPNPVPAGGK